MNATQIQQFLNSKNSVCLKDTNKKYQSLVDDNGDGVVADGGSESYGRHAPMTAAQLINAAAKIYKINPQVILVTLQKEQGLITRTDCPQWRYNTALGYGCPDTAPCDNSAFGFTRQIDYGTYHFRGYFNDSLTYVPFGTGNHRIYYNPNQSCGSSIVNIQNRATASLYSYTPYQPNAAALAAGYGEAPCGAYGNRNFYLFFTSWFGSTQATYNFEKMETARYLIPKQDGVRKINLSTGEVTDAALNEGQLVYFTGRVMYQGGWCLRSQYDRDNDNKYCVPFSALKEVELNFTNISNTRIKITNSQAIKYNPITKSSLSVLNNEQVLTVSQRFTFDNVEYYRSAYDVTNNNAYGIRTSDAQPYTLQLDEIPEVNLYINSKASNLRKTDLWTMSPASSVQPLSYRQQIVFVATTRVNGVDYYISKHDYNSGNPSYAVQASILSPFIYEGFVTPRNMRVSKQTCKFDLASKANTSVCYQPGELLFFKTKTTVDGKIWYRSSWETDHNTNLVINPQDVVEL